MNLKHKCGCNFISEKLKYRKDLGLNNSVVFRDLHNIKTEGQTIPHHKKIEITYSLSNATKDLLWNNLEMFETLPK